MEESKENTLSDLPEPIRVKGLIAMHLLEALTKTVKQQKTVVDGEPKGDTKSLEAKFMRQSLELDMTKANLKRAEDDTKQKFKAIEELEGKVEKLSERLKISPWTPYALIQKHHFDHQPGPHDCLCIVCGERMKGVPVESSGDSPEVVFSIENKNSRIRQSRQQAKLSYLQAIRAQESWRQSSKRWRMR